MRTAEALRSFLAVFPAELPDKTMVATLVLTTRYRQPVHVWLGASAAFLVHVAVAVTAGRFLGLLPEPAVQLAVAALFAGGAVVLWRSAGVDEDEHGAGGTVPARGAFAGSLAVVLLAEWGDLTQLATAGLAARSESPVATGVGAFVALCTVAALASFAGASLARRLPVDRLRRAAAVIFALLAVGTLVELAVA